MALGFSHRGTLFIVLDEDNIDRLQQFDPFEFNAAQASAPLTLVMPLRVVICYARKEEYAKLLTMQDFSPDAVVKYLFRGYRVTAADAEREYPYRLL